MQLAQFAGDALSSWFISMAVVSVVLMSVFTLDEFGSTLLRPRK